MQTLQRYKKTRPKANINGGSHAKKQQKHLLKSTGYISQWWKIERNKKAAEIVSKFTK